MEENKQVRLNKFISSSGFTSRRKADELIEQGRVKVNGVVALVGTKVNIDDEISVNDKLIKMEDDLVYIAFNKPVVITCTTDLRDKDNIIEYINFDKRIFPVGRLDKDSNGLILLTNDGDIVNKILRSDNNHEKRYEVTVDKSISKVFIEEMAQGVKIYNANTNQYEKTKPCIVNKLSEFKFEIILTQGLNRQIRRMASELNYHVTTLRRTRIMNIELNNLGMSQFRYLKKEELEELNRMINEN